MPISNVGIKFWYTDALRISALDMDTSDFALIIHRFEVRKNNYGSIVSIIGFIIFIESCCIHIFETSWIFKTWQNVVKVMQ